MQCHVIKIAFRKLLTCLSCCTTISKAFIPKIFAKYIVYVLRIPTLDHICSLSRIARSGSVFVQLERAFCTSLWEAVCEQGGPQTTSIYPGSNEGFVLSPKWVVNSKTVRIPLCSYVFTASSGPQISIGFWFRGKAPSFKINACMTFPYLELISQQGSTVQRSLHYFVNILVAKDTNG